jgi:hypothetical protein
MTNDEVPNDESDSSLGGSSFVISGAPLTAAAVRVLSPPSVGLGQGCAGAFEMGTRRLRGFGLMAALGGALGCSTSNGPNLRTPVPEQYTLPPADDSRFTQPISYPKDVLNQEPIKAPSAGKLPSQQGPIAPGGGGGLGRGGTPGGF